MITEKDLKEAIAECQGERNPNANTCIKLAAYYTILNQMNPQMDSQVNTLEPIPYSFNGPEITYYSETEFGQLLLTTDINDVLLTIDELMSTLQVLYPKLYNGVIRRLK